MDKQGKIYFLCLLGVVATLGLGMTILPMFTSKDETIEKILGEYENQKPLYDSDNPAYDIFIPPENSFGIEEWRELNYSHFWNLFRSHSAWQLQAWHPIQEEWVSEWQGTNLNEWLDIDRNRSDDNSSEKITLTVNNEHPFQDLFFRFIFGIDIRVKNYVNRSSWYEYEITYPANETEDYTVFFNFSDIKPLIQSGAVSARHGVRDYHGDDYFWFMITQNMSRNPLKSGASFEIDPTFGYTNTGNDCTISTSSGTNYYRGAWATMGSNGGTADSITVKFSTLGSTESYECALYEYVDYSSSYAGGQVALTEIKEVGSGEDGSIVVFDFSEPKPVLDADTKYYLLIRIATPTSGNNYLDGSSVSGYTIYDTSVSIISFDNPLTGENPSSLRPYIYCSYTESGSEPSEWWDTDWDYYKTINVADKVDDYQHFINISFSSGGNVTVDSHSQTDFDDIRFVYDNTTELPYWIETVEDSSYAWFWVNNSGNYSSFEMFYGNDAVGNVSNGITTFDHFENWSSQSIDGRWDIKATDGSVSYASTDATHGGYVQKLEGDAGSNRYYYISTRTFPTDYGYRFRGKFEITQDIYQLLINGWEGWGATGEALIRMDGGNTGRITVKDCDDDGSVNELSDGYFGSYFVYDIDRVDDNANLIINDNEIGSYDIAPDNCNMGITIYCRDSEYDLYTDWLFIHKIKSDCPTLSFGDEVSQSVENNIPYFSQESPANNSVDVSLTPTLSIYANDTDGDSMTLTWYEGNRTKFVEKENWDDIYANQGIIANDTFLWTIDNNYINQSWRSNGTQKESHDTTSDGTYGSHYGDGCLHDGYLYVTTCNYPDTPKKGGIAVHYANNLTFKNEYLFSKPVDYPSGVCFYNNSFWVVYDNVASKVVSKYDTSFTLGSRTNYSLDYTISGSHGYQGIVWYNEHIFLPIHEGSTPSITVDRYRWNGEGFDTVKRYNYSDSEIPDDCSQGIDFYDDYFFFAQRFHPVASQNSVVRCNLIGWNKIQTNSSCVNGTYTCVFSNSTGYGNIYYWKIVVDDGTDTNTSWYNFTTKDEPVDTTIPEIIINFAGNLSDSGGPYWRPPGESTQLTGVFSDGYYANSSRQSENFTYINISITEAESDLSSVYLNWYNQSSDTWTNDTYGFSNMTGGFWEINTSEHFDVFSGHNYSFNINATSDGGTNTTWWNKTGIGGYNTRRYVQLNCTPTNITYTPFYYFNATYGQVDVSKHDRMKNDQGPDGMTHDSGKLLTDIPTDEVHYRYCSNFVVYSFYEQVCIEPFELENIYYHFWWDTRDNELGGTGTDTDRLYHPYYGIAEQYTTDEDNNESYIYYETPEGENNFSLNTTMLYLSDTFNFTDNNIYELFNMHKGEVISGVDNTTVISNRSFTSFCIFNVPSNETLNASYPDSDSDSLSDYEELWVYYTNPWLADTDNDGVTDYDETLSGSDPNNYTNTLEPEDREWRDDMLTGYFNFSNSSSYRGLVSGFYNFSNSSSYRRIISGYFNFSNSPLYRRLISGYYNFSNSSSHRRLVSGYFNFSDSAEYNSVTVGWFNFSSESRLYRELVSGFFNFSNSSYYKCIVSGWFNFSNTSTKSYRKVAFGYFDFSNSSSYRRTVSGYFNFSNSSSHRRLVSGWFNFSNIAPWSAIDNGWFSFGTNIEWQKLVSGYFNFSNQTVSHRRLVSGYFNWSNSTTTVWQNVSWGYFTFENTSGCPGADFIMNIVGINIICTSTSTNTISSTLYEWRIDSDFGYAGTTGYQYDLTEQTFTVEDGGIYYITLNLISGSCADSITKSTGEISENKDRLEAWRYTTEGSCEGAGWYWYDNACHDEPEPDEWDEEPDLPDAGEHSKFDVQIGQWRINIGAILLIILILLLLLFVFRRRGYYEYESEE